MAIGFLNRLEVDLSAFAFRLWINTILGSRIVPRDARSFLLRLSGFDIRGRINVYPKVSFGSNLVSFGKNVMVNSGTVFDNSGPIVIGDNVAFGQDCLILTTTHLNGDSQRRSGALVSLSVTVENGSWIGARVVILPGVKVAYGCIIAAGAVVVEDTTPNGLYAGIPAKRKKDLF